MNRPCCYSRGHELIFHRRFPNNVIYGRMEALILSSWRGKIVLRQSRDGRLKSRACALGRKLPGVPSISTKRKQIIDARPSLSSTCRSIIISIIRRYFTIWAGNVVCSAVSCRDCSEYWPALAAGKVPVFNRPFLGQSFKVSACRPRSLFHLTKNLNSKIYLIFSNGNERKVKYS